MGGDTMCEILEAGKQRLGGVTRLVLQPNGGERELRQWLAGNGYQIVSEELLRENRFDYEIIVAEPGRVCIAQNSCTSAGADAGKARRLGQVAAHAAAEAADPGQFPAGPRRGATGENRRLQSAGGLDHPAAGLIHCCEQLPISR
jgi:hypothetical protein